MSACLECGGHGGKHFSHCSERQPTPHVCQQCDHPLNWHNSSGRCMSGHAVGSKDDPCPCGDEQPPIVCCPCEPCKALREEIADAIVDTWRVAMTNEATILATARRFADAAMNVLAERGVL